MRISDVSTSGHSRNDIIRYSHTVRRDTRFVIGIQAP